MKLFASAQSQLRHIPATQIHSCTENEDMKKKGKEGVVYKQTQK